MTDTNIQKHIALVKAVDCGSFTKAAQALSYSQSGISRMIRDLETEWDLPLLERNRSGIQLTSEGVKLLPYIRELCDKFEQLQQQVASVHGLQSGLIRIGTFSSVATHWLPNIIKEFQKSFPNIQFEILLGDYTEIENWVLEGRADCGFLPLFDHTSLEAIALAEDKLMVVLPEGHPLTAYDRVPYEALSQYPFILLEKGHHSEIREFFKQYNIPLRPSFVTLDDYAIMSMVENGLGISMLPQLILQRCPYRIVQKELNVPAWRKIYFVIRESDTLPLVVRRFLDHLVYR